MRLALLLLVSCSVPEPTDIVEPEDLASVAEAYCVSRPELPCGHVFAFPETENFDEGNKLGVVEKCVPQPYVDPITMLARPTLEEAEALFGPSIRSPDKRFTEPNSWLCWWCCGPGCGPGCNAYTGCFCGVTP